MGSMSILSQSVIKFQKKINKMFINSYFLKPVMLIEINSYIKIFKKGSPGIDGILF